MVTRKGISVFAKVWLPILLLLHKARALQTKDGWKSIITSLAKFHGATFRDQVAKPMVQLSANAYRYLDVIKVPWWTSACKVVPVAPARGRMHTLIYKVEQLSHSSLRVSLSLVPCYLPRTAMKSGLGFWACKVVSKCSFQVSPCRLSAY